MMVNNLKEIEDAKAIILEMKERATNEGEAKVFQTMLDQLLIGDVENMYNPEFISITQFGYNIFQVLHRI